MRPSSTTLAHRATNSALPTAAHDPSGRQNSQEESLVPPRPRRPPSSGTTARKSPPGWSITPLGQAQNWLSSALAKASSPLSSHRQRVGVCPMPAVGLSSPSAEANAEAEAPAPAAAPNASCTATPNRSAAAEHLDTNKTSKASQLARARAGNQRQHQRTAQEKTSFSDTPHGQAQQWLEGVDVAGRTSMDEDEAGEAKLASSTESVVSIKRATPYRV